MNAKATCNSCGYPQIHCICHLTETQRLATDLMRKRENAPHGLIYDLDQRPFRVQLGDNGLPVDLSGDSFYNPPSTK